MVFLHFLAQKCQFPREFYHSLSAKLKKPWVFAYFPKSRSNRNNSLPLLLFDWTALSQKFKIIENAWFFCTFWHKSVNFPGNFIIVCQQNSKNHGFLHIFQNPFQIETIPFLCFYLIGLLWVKSSKSLKTHGFFALFGTKVSISQGILS